MKKQEPDFGLHWIEDSKMENGGFWICPVCGAVYCRPKDWIPKASYCMKCKVNWFGGVEN